MTSQQLNYFFKLAKELNYTSVANMFYITQPTLSRQIMTLEEELGFPLFTRGKNTICLTPEGQMLSDELQPLVHDAEKLIERIKKNYLKKMNSISIGVMDEQLISETLISAVNRFRQLHPEITFDFDCQTHASLRNGLVSGKYDIIDTILFPQDSLSKTFMTICLEEEPMYIAIKNSLEPELSETITLSQFQGLLKKYPLFLPVIDAPNSYSPEEELAGKLSMPNFLKGPTIVHEGNPLSITMQVISGLGVTITNKTHRLSLDPSVKIMRIDCPGHYKKGIHYCTGSANPLLPEFIRLIENESSLAS